MTPTAEDRINRAGLRITHQRCVVLTALMREPNDATAAALFERLRPTHPKLGLATIYRTLHSLAEAGIVDALAHGGSTCYRYCAPGHHHHLTCRSCHRVVEIRNCDLGAWSDRQVEQYGFRSPQHMVELTGLCAAC